MKSLRLHTLEVVTVFLGLLLSSLGFCASTSIDNSVGAATKAQGNYAPQVDNIIGVWESDTPENHWRMKVEFSSQENQYKGYLVQQGELSEKVGFSKGELVWLATPNPDNPKVLKELQKWRTDSEIFTWEVARLDVSDIKDTFYSQAAKSTFKRVSGDTFYRGSDGCSDENDNNKHVVQNITLSNRVENIIGELNNQIKVPDFSIEIYFESAGSLNACFSAKDKKIYVDDNFKDRDDDLIRFMLAHELGHFVHNDTENKKETATGLNKTARDKLSAGAGLAAGAAYWKYTKTKNLGSKLIESGGLGAGAAVASYKVVDIYTKLMKNVACARVHEYLADSFAVHALNRIGMDGKEIAKKFFLSTLDFSPTIIDAKTKQKVPALNADHPTHQQRMDAIDNNIIPPLDGDKSRSKDCVYDRSDHF